VQLVYSSFNIILPLISGPAPSSIATATNGNSEAIRRRTGTATSMSECWRCMVVLQVLGYLVVVVVAEPPLFETLIQIVRQENEDCC
jgi:hypothetical protein